MAGNTALALGTWPYTLAPMGLVPGEPQSVQDLKSNPDNKAGNRTNCLQNKRINPERFHVPQTLQETMKGFLILSLLGFRPCAAAVRRG